jgi:caspase 2
MSHGNEDNIVTRDSELMSFKEIMAPIKSCPTLENKPKMFFFQACRGDNKMESRVSSASSTKSFKGAQMTDSFPLTSKSLNNREKIPSKFNEEKDLFVYYSTLPDHLSYSNNVAEGTIFIQSFCNIFAKAYENLKSPDHLSLSQMIIKINASVSKTENQIADPIFRMSKEIYFLPKDVRSIFKDSISFNLFFFKRILFL